jgi:hypothetical protein
MALIDFGETATMAVTVTDSAGDPGNAAAAPTWTLTDPTGTVTHPTATTTGTGLYQATVTASVAGRWVWSASATGGVLGSSIATWGDVFDVSAAEDIGLLSVSALREYLGNVPVTDDEKLREIILEATEICEDVTGKTWRRKTITGEVHDGGVRAIRLLHTPASATAVTAVTENGASIPASGWFVDVSSRWLCRGTTTMPMMWLPGNQNVTVTYTAGPPDGVVPRGIMRGMKELCRDFWSVQRGGRNRRDEDLTLDPRSGHLLPLPVLQAWQLKKEYPVG